MAKQNLIAALDIGGGKITAVAATIDQQKNVVKILAGDEFRCEGLEGGIVTDIRETTATIIETINYLEEATQADINALYIALRGEHIESFTSKGSFNIARVDKEITQEDIKHAIESAKSIPIKNNSEILSTVPQGFYIDRQPVKNPEGMEATSIDVDVHITTGLTATFNNLNRAFDRAKCDITGRFYGLLCLADTVLTPEEKEMGTLIIDLGRDNTSAGIFVDGALRCSYDIKLGSDLITSDIAKVLRISHKEAEKIKINYGTTSLDNENGGETEITISTLNGEETKINRDYLLDIIRPRVQEIFDTVKEKIQESGFYDCASTAVLTGGGSLLPGIQEQARSSLNIKEVVCSTVQRDFVECDKQFLNPKYATAVALSYFVARREMMDTITKGGSRSKGFLGGIIEAIKNFFKNSDFFGG
ncbi:MAG: cell division protein FtsA [Elusimicrobiaceae bacterium]|nr:cell division protein FtsA [Elusimicrobiaceae bacterium]